MPPWYVVVSLPLLSSSQPSKVEKEELFMVGDGVNKDDNDVMIGDIITVWQPAEQKRALLVFLAVLPAERERKRERYQAPKD